MDSVTFHLERERELRIRVPDNEANASIRLVESINADDSKKPGGGRGGRGRGGRGGRGGSKLVVDVCGALLHPNVRHCLCAGTTIVIRAWTSSVWIEVKGSAQLREEGCDIGTNGLHARPALEYHNILNAARRHAYNMFIAGGGAATINPQSVAAALGAAGTEGDTHAKEGGVVESPAERLARMDRYGVGPRVLVMGKACSGRHTFVRTLGNYASRLGYCPTIVDLCPSASQCVGLPGSIGAAIQESPLTSDCGNTYDGFPSICYPVGVTEPQSPDALSYDALSNDTGGRSIYGAYSAAVMELCGVVARRLSLSAIGSMSSHSGCIVCAPPLRGKDGVDLLVKIIECLGVTHVLCIGDAQMYGQISKQCNVLAPFTDNNYQEPSTPEDASTFVAKHRPHLILPSGYRFAMDFLSVSPAVVYRSPEVRRAFGVSRCRLYLGGGGQFQVTSIRHSRKHEAVSVFQLTVMYYRRSGSAVAQVGAEVAPSAPGAIEMLAAHPHNNVGGSPITSALPYFISQWATLSPTIPNPTIDESGKRARPFVAPMSWSVSGPARATKMTPAEIKASVGSIVAVMDASPTSNSSGRHVASLTNLESRPVAVFGHLIHADIEDLEFVAPVPEPALSEFTHLALVLIKFQLT